MTNAGPGRIGRDRPVLAAWVSLLLAAGVCWSQNDTPSADPGLPSAEGATAVVGAPAGPPRSGDELSELTEEVAAGMRCPVCQGLSVADSPTDPATAMKARVGDLLAMGYSPEQVLTYFEASYGEFIRLSPKPEGFNLVVWLLPVVMLLVGGALVARKVRGRQESPPMDEAELERLREQVRREVAS